ncbi:MAG: presenilin family intramembrane aspartyl protease [archaeon]|jgi:presenilin-like A22 family membrane protease|nr:presenilin family intramembrane aspartyl protease [archaeon]
MEKSLLLKLCALFIVTQLIGIAVAVPFISATQTGEYTPTGVVTEDPDDPINAIGLFGMILVSTAIFLIFLKLFKGAALFKVLEAIVVFSASLIVFWTLLELAMILLGVWEIVGGLALFAALALALALVATRVLWPKNLILRNLSSSVSVAGVGVLIGISLGVVPVIIFLILLTIYDFIAVFKTKHMIVLAKGISKKNLAFTFALPSKELKHQFELGTGDMVMPLTFAVAVMNSSAMSGVAFPNYIIPGVLVLIGSLAGLLWTIDYISKHVGIALPALPPQTVIMLLMWGVGKLAGF